MPSSLARGPVFRFLNVVRKLFISSDGYIQFEPRDTAPTGATEGAVYVGTDGKLYVHDGTGFVVAGTQA